MVKGDSSIQTKFFYKMIYIVLIAASLWCLIWIGTEFLSFKSESNALRVQYILSQKAMLKTQVTILVNNIRAAKKQIEHTLESKPMDDVTLQAQKSVLERIISRRFGPEGYFFGSTFKGDPLFSNEKITVKGDNIWNITDPNGVKIIQEQSKIAIENPEGGFVQYSWTKLNSNTASPKISYVKGIPEWGWTIGAGIYLDTIEKTILQNKTALYSRLKTKIIQSLIAMGLLLGLIYFWAKNIGHQMQQSIDTFVSSLKQRDADLIKINPEDIQLKEFREIALVSNQCFIAKTEAQKKLIQSEKKLRRHTENLKAIFNNSPNILVLVNEDARVEMINHKGASFTDRKQEDLIGLLGGEVFNCMNSFDGNGCGCNPDCSICPVRTRAMSTLETGQPHKEEEGQMTFLVHDKEISMDLLISTTLLELNGKARVLLSLTDITERKLGEIEKKKLEKQVQQSQKMESIGTLAGGIAHDFNNILFPVIGYTEMLIEDIPEDSPLKESLEQIYNGALRAKDLVKQILTFARQKDGELKLMQMQPMVKEAIKLIRSTIPTTISIKQNIQTDCRPIKADPTQIHQIVMNLATNAYHSMEEKGGELKISLKEMEFEEHDLVNSDITSGVYACLTITDTGKGMDQDLILKIFDPFFTTKGKGKGTGMGLSVVHGIVKNMGGAIRVYSEPGKGSEFNVYLPVVKTISADQLTDIKEPLLTGTEHILLVDDEVPILKMEQDMLERLGYTVTTRSSSIDALEAFHANPDKFDLVITDMAMPNMAGDKLAIELTRIRPDILILLCTGFSEIMSEEKAKSLGIQGFLLKPVISKALSQKIREVLE